MKIELLDRDTLVAAISHWLRWRGHTLSHDVFSQRFAVPSGAHTFKTLRRAARTMGVELRLSEGQTPPGESASGQREFPAIAVLRSGTCALVRGRTPTGQWVCSNLGVPVAGVEASEPSADAAAPAPAANASTVLLADSEDIVGWLRPQIERRRLHEELFGPSQVAHGWIWAALRAQWSLYLQGAVGASIINVLAALSALYTMQVYDRVIPTNATSTLWALTIGVLVLYAFDFVLRSLRSHVIDTASRRVDLRLAGFVFQRALSIRMEARPQHMGMFISQLREHEGIREFLLSGVLFVISDLPFIIFFLILIFAIGGSMAWVPLLLIPALILLSLILQWPLARLARENQKESAARSGLLIEAVEGAETLKTLNAEWRMSRRWHELSQLLAGTTLRNKFWSNLNNNLAYTFQQVGYVLMTVYGAYLVARGEVTTGAMVAVGILLGRCLQPISGLVNLMVRVHQVRTSAQTLERIMTLPVDRPADTSFVNLEKHTGDIVCENLQFSYTGNDHLALNVASLKITPGEKIAVLGRTGSGKSTLVRLLSGLYQPTRGRIRLDGVDIQQVDPTRLRETVGYLTQDVKLFAGTLKENLLLGCGPVSDDELMAAIKFSGVERVIAQHPLGLGMPIYEGGGGLSGGQKQSVGIARLILCKPQILLLDEPTASMDQQTESELIAKLGWVRNPEVTLIVVTHKPTMLAWADRIIVMDQGQIVADGPKDSVLRQLGAPSGLRVGGPTTGSNPTPPPPPPPSPPPSTFYGGSTMHGGMA